MTNDDMYKHLGEVAYGFLNSLLKEKKQNAKNFFVKHKVGFMPEGMDYSDYHKLKKSALFKQLKNLIGNHWSLSIFLTGLHIASLDRTSKKKSIVEIRQAVFNEHKAKGVSILNMAATSFIMPYTKWLLKYTLENNLSQSQVIDLHEKSLDDWQERTIFVKTCHKEKTIVNKCISKMGIGKNGFLVG